MAGLNNGQNKRNASNGTSRNTDDAQQATPQSDRLDDAMSVHDEQSRQQGAKRTRHQHQQPQQQQTQREQHTSSSNRSRTTSSGGRDSSKAYANETRSESGESYTAQDFDAKSTSSRRGGKSDTSKMPRHQSVSATEAEPEVARDMQTASGTADQRDDESNAIGAGSAMREEQISRRAELGSGKLSADERSRSQRVGSDNLDTSGVESEDDRVNVASEDEGNQASLNGEHSEEIPRSKGKNGIRASTTGTKWSQSRSPTGDKH